MKSLQKICQLLLIVVCAAPLLANASAIDVTRPFDRKVTKSQQIKKAKGQSCCATRDLHLLSPAPDANTNLRDGAYVFGQLTGSHPRTAPNWKFTDEWTFSLAESGQISLTLLDLNHANKFAHPGNAKLKLELFDGSNNSLGSITGNHSLNLLLAANTLYSFVVSGNAHGNLGGSYLGILQACPSPAAVPIGDALPMFSAALLLLGWQFRTRSRQGTPHTPYLAAG